MSKYRSNLPQLSDRLFLTDSGMETTLIFHDGLDLPLFASFDLMRRPDGVTHTRAYYERHIAMAKENGLGFVLESPTWRASPAWGDKLGYSREELAAANCACVALMSELRETHENPAMPIVISGNIGPRGDGYKVDSAMSASEAEDYHAWQIGVFAHTAADMVSAFTLNYVEEGLGIARAAKAVGMPVVLSFTLETDGRLPSGQTLQDAITQVDCETGKAPAYYMINCAHPTHFDDALRHGEDWLSRVRGIRANASKRSHAELDEATDLDIGDPVELGRHYRDLRARMRQLTVLGGCCGTDHRHVEQICLACTETDLAA